MKRISLYLLLAFMCMGAFSQYTYTEFSMSEFKGLLLSYDYSWSYIANSKTSEPFFQPYHTGFIGIIGPIDATTGTSTGYAYEETTTSGSFGAMGLVLGAPTKDVDYSIKQFTNYYTSKGDRILSYESKPLGVIGGRVRFIGLIGETKRSIASNYYFMDMEFMHYRFNATVQKGAFNHYIFEEEKIGINEINFNGGIKFLVFKLSGGVGVGWGLYEVGKKYKSPNDDEEIKNQIESKEHFTANVSLGISLDFCRYEF